MLLGKLLGTTYWCEIQERGSESSGYKIICEDICILRAIGWQTQSPPIDPEFTLENAQALRFLRHHLYDTPKDEYMAKQSALAFGPLKQRLIKNLKYYLKPRVGWSV